MINTGLRAVGGLAPVSHSLLRLVITEQADLTSLGSLDLPNLRDCLLHNNALTSMDGLQGCPKLQRLWLHGNKLTRISALENAGDLRELWLQANALQDLSGGLEHAVSLQVLQVGGNPITNLQHLHKLAHLPALRSIGFRDSHFGDCPVTAVDGYRHFVTVSLPQVTIIDEAKVSPDERSSSADAVLSLGDELQSELQALQAEYDDAFSALNARVARHGREAAAVAAELSASLATLWDVVQEGEGLVQAELQRTDAARSEADTHLAAAQQAVQDRTAAWAAARQAALQTGHSRDTSAVEQRQAVQSWRDAAAEQGVDVLEPFTAAYKSAAHQLQAPSPALTEQLQSQTHWAVDFSACRRLGSPAVPASTAWVPSALHSVAQVQPPSTLPPLLLLAPIPSPTTHPSTWEELAVAQGGDTCIAFNHAADALAWAASQGMLLHGSASLCLLRVARADGWQPLTPPPRPPALLSPACIQSVEVPTVIPMPGGQGETGAVHWAVAVPRGTTSAVVCLGIAGLHAGAVRDPQEAAAALSAWSGAASQGHGEHGDAPPPLTFLQQAVASLDSAREQHKQALARDAPVSTIAEAEAAAAEHARAAAAVAGVRRAIDSARAQQEALLQHMASAQ